MSRILPALVLAIAACKGTEPFVGTPTAISVSPKVVAISALGAQRQFHATVLDQRGNPISGTALVWSVDDSSIATVNGAGLLISARNGVTKLHVKVAQDSLADSASISIIQVPARLVKLLGDHQGDTVSGTLPTPVTVQVNDSADHPVAAIVVNFAVTQGGGHLSKAADTTDASGQASVLWTLGSSPGPNAMSATSAISLTGSPVSFSANAVLAGSSPTLATNSGDREVGQIGAPVNFPPSVIILGGGGVPLVGVPVTFAVTSGGGLLTGASVITDANGVATLGSWVLGAGVNELTATATDTATIVGNPATFSDSGLAPAYHIDVRFLTTMTTAERAAFTNAATKWQSIIFGDVPDVPVTLPAGSCGSNSPALNETIDDIVIFAAIDSIDGPGNILGQANYCATRKGSHLPLAGIMEFDIADVTGLLNSGSFDLVIEHEMGHVLGFGTIWSSSQLIDPWSLSNPGADPHFVGSQVLAAFDRVGGLAYTASAKVPVENSGGDGTANGHWRESVFNTELMTGFLDPGVNPLSLVTVASLGDLGYRVNYAAADPYSLSLALRAGPGQAVFMGNDIKRIPILVVDAAGKVVGTIPRR